MYHPLSLAVGVHPHQGPSADRAAAELLVAMGFILCSRLRRYVPPAQESYHHQHRRITTATTRLTEDGFPVAHFHHARPDRHSATPVCCDHAQPSPHR